MSENSIQPIEGGADPLVARIHVAMGEMKVAEVSKAAAEAELDQLISTKIEGEEDPFLAMMNAMLYVIPQLMKCKEEGLVEKTASYDYVSSLNAYMAETQTRFAYSGDRDVASGDEYQSGKTSYTDEYTGVHGLAAGIAYRDNLQTLQSESLLAALPGDVQGIMNEAITTTLSLNAKTPNSDAWAQPDGTAKKEYNVEESLWAGLNSAKWKMSEDGTQYSNNQYDPGNGQEGVNYFKDEGKTEAAYVSGKLAPVIDDAVTQNTILENTLNGYSKQVESEFKFEMENYNTIVNMDGQMYQAQIHQNSAHAKRLRAV